MSRKRKLYAQPPPLSTIDKLIYASLFVLIIIYIIAFPLLLISVISRDYALSFGNLIATKNPYIALWILPFYLISGFTPTVFLALLLHRKQPFIGNKKYQTNKPTLKVYPILSHDWKKRPKKELSEKETKRNKIIKCFSLMIVFITLSMCFIGIIPRMNITEDYRVEKYNIFNKVTDNRSISEATELIIGVIKGRHRSTNYGISLTFKFDDGKEYRFSLAHFAIEDYEEKLNEALKIKSMLSNKQITVNDKHFDRLLKWEKFTEKETELIYELFSK